MGAGKSFIGEQLAKRLNFSFVDIDREIEKSAGMLIHQIFEHQGEAAFRLWEEKELARLLQSQKPMIIATGGGCVLAKKNRQQLKDRCWVIYLRVSGSVAIERCGCLEKVRPLLQSENPLKRWESLFLDRQMHYEDLADVVFNTDGVSAENLIQAIIKGWEGRDV
jgi:shikimate kinase